MKSATAAKKSNSKLHSKPRSGKQDSEKILYIYEQLHALLDCAQTASRGNFQVRVPPQHASLINDIGTAFNAILASNEKMVTELQRVRELVGKEGRIHERAEILPLQGAWADSLDAVNSLIADLVHPTNEAARVLTAVANGNLAERMATEKSGVPLKGEFSGLSTTVNSMVSQLSSFASEVTRVAKEVGTEGKLGGQADVKGVSGTWKDLTESVNQLAGNLTSQVRAISEVSTAVAKGDLTRLITVEARGEVAELKNNINRMIGNLRETTDKNNDQDWLKTNLAKFSAMMQGQRSVTAVAQLIMNELTPLVGGQYGTFFLMEGEKDDPGLSLIASYAFSPGKHGSTYFQLKEGLVGQAAFERKRILLPRVPEGYVRIASSLGHSQPCSIVVLPILFEGELKAVIELAALEPFSVNHLNFLDQLMDSIGVVLNMISTNMRTEQLLQELKRSNAELETQANELEEKAKLLEIKNQEVELASRSLEEKAAQLALISKYKSEFLANMSHELRTPLNCLLILSKTLAENKARNLTSDQVKFADTIYGAGNELLSLINEILDLSKVEAGKMPVIPGRVFLSDVKEYLCQTFRPVAEHKGLEFRVETKNGLPSTILTDNNRLHQILKNLLSNAFKFTENGGVTLTISPPPGRTQPSKLVSFSVSDTGIGIHPENQKLIFEAFQQADGTTSRKYGGTGLGLTISREIASLLGGSIEVKSIPGEGSTFTLHLPVTYPGPENGMAPPESAGDLPRQPSLPDNVNFNHKKILVVDDDIRNIFAITSVLEPRGMRVLFAENGKIGIGQLDDHPDVDLVLMDVMMPEMDGLEATRRIRNNPRYKDLPIISLTAKAMKGDREKIISAGASDYVTKPVDPERLLAMMHEWLKGEHPGENLKEIH